MVSGPSSAEHSSYGTLRSGKVRSAPSSPQRSADAATRSLPSSLGSILETDFLLDDAKLNK